jgi:hypothetical protein
MQKAGGIVALISGIFATMAAVFTLFVGGVGAAFKADSASTIVWLGWGGIGFSFFVIILGAIAMGASSRVPGVLLILASIAGAILGGTFVAVCLVLALIGGTLATFGVKKTEPAVAK